MGTNYPINPFGQNATMPSGYPIADNLKTDSAQQALSARQGKVLNEKLPRVFDTEDGEFFIIDEQHNAIAEFSGGHVETQNFNSRQVATNTNAIQQLQSQIGQQGSAQSDVVVKEDNDAALDFADPAGNVVMRVTNYGHIKTKGFDSENIDMFRAMKLDEPQCICHGYGAATGTANTIPYFRSGVAKGYKFFEVDAVNCSDGVPVCTHYYETLTVYDKTTHEATTVQTTTVNGTKTIQMSSTDLVGGYTWDAAGNVPIALLSDVIWYICYFNRYPLHVDGQGLNPASRLAASQYAESLGVGKYVFHELPGGAYTSWSIPCNAIIACSTAADIQSAAASYKKADNNIIFYVNKSAASVETVTALASAAHAAGCYLMVYTYSSSELETMRSLFKAGMDFIITSGVTNSSI